MSDNSHYDDSVFVHGLSDLLEAAQETNEKLDKIIKLLEKLNKR